MIVSSAKGGGASPSFLICFVVCLILLQFNALPTDQTFLASIFLLIITCLGFNLRSILFIFRSHPRLTLFFAAGPLYLSISPFIISYWPWLSLWMAVNFLLLYLTFLIVLSIKVKFENMLMSFVLAIAINSVIVIFLSFQGVGRPSGFLTDPNLAADFCALAILSTFFLLQQSPRVFHCFLQFVLGVAFFLSISRGASFALLGAMVVYISLAQYKKIPWLRTTLLTALILALAFAVTSIILSNLSALNGLSIADRPESLADRFDMWRSAWIMIQEHPFWGTGLGTFALRYPALRAASETTSAGFFAHNDYLQLLAELGIFGFIALFLAPVSLIIVCIRRFVKAHEARDIKFLCFALASISLIAAHSLVNFIIYHPLINIFIGFVLASAVMGSNLTQHPNTFNFINNEKKIGIGHFFVILFFMVVAGTAITDTVARELITKKYESANQFSLRSPDYNALLALSYFSPLNVEIQNYLVLGQVNTALTLAGSPMGTGLMKQAIGQIDKNDWLQWENCPQQVSKARLLWLSDKNAAMEVLRSVLKKVPSCIQARITLSEALLSRQAYKQAIRLLNDGIDRFPFGENKGAGPVVLLETLVRAYKLSGDPTSAAAISAYITEFKHQQSLRQKPEWSRHL